MQERYILALHLIFMVTWFAGLFYFVRLLVYHAEAQEKNEPEKSILINQYKLMEKRLWYGITWPGMILTLSFGIWLAVLHLDFYLTQPWFLIKMFLVFLLVLYHLQCHRLFNKFQNNKPAWNSLKLRIFNEGATLLLFGIILLAVPKENNRIIWIITGLLGVAIGVYVGVIIYRKKRNKNS